MIGFMQRSKATVHFCFGVLLVLLCFGVYANVLNGAFIWDDQLQVVRNGNIRTLDNIPRAFTTSLWSFMYSNGSAEENRVFDQYYRPLQTIIYILAYRLGGLSPLVYHLINVILHCAATLLVYLLCLELRLPSTIAFMAGALFGTHPVHTEAVSWIAGVGDLLCGIFYFAALAAFLRYRSSQKPVWLWMSSLSFLGALLSKEMAATLPGVIVLLMLMAPKRQRPDLKRAISILAPYLLAMAAYGALRIAAAGLNPSATIVPAASPLDWITFGLWIVGHYLRYSVAPYPLYIYHLVPLHFHDRVLSTVLYGTCISAVAVLLWTLRHRFREAPLWLAIFGVMLAPVLYFKGISGGVFFAERYLYLPSMAIVVLAGILLARWSRTRAIVVACSITFVFSLLTIQRNRDWHDEEALFQRTLQFQPEAVNIWTSVAEIYLRREDNTRALEYFQNALKRTSDTRFLQSSYESYRIYLGLGTVAARQAKPAEAVEYLQKAMEIYPQGDGAYTQLGGVLITWGQRYGDAMVLLEKAIQLSAVNEFARDYMGVALVNQGKYEQAIKYFREALEINPDLESAKQHLQVALQAKNH